MVHRLCQHQHTCKIIEHNAYVIGRFYEEIALKFCGKSDVTVEIKDYSITISIASLHLKRCIAELPLRAKPTALTVSAHFQVI